MQGIFTYASYWCTENLLDAWLCILLMRGKFTGCMAMHFTDAQKIYWMHGCAFYWCTENLLDAWLCILLMHRKFTGCMAMHFTDAQKIYWMHGCPSSRIIRVHALRGANSWSAKKMSMLLANQIAGILRPILYYTMGLRIPAIWLAKKRGFFFYWPTVCAVQDMYAYNACTRDSHAFQ